MLYAEQFHCMLHHSISDSSRKGRHIQFITTNELLKKKFIFFSLVLLTAANSDPHIHTQKNALSPANLFVADGGVPTASGTTLILLGGKKQINEQVNLYRA